MGTEYMKMYYKKRRDASPYIVYYLPKEDYYGHTKDVISRMARHEGQGRDISGYVILHEFDNKEDALVKEQHYQKKSLICSACNEEKRSTRFLKGYKGIADYKDYSDICIDCHRLGTVYNYSVIDIVTGDVYINANTFKEIGETFNYSHERIRQLSNAGRLIKKQYSVRTNRRRKEKDTR